MRAGIYKYLSSIRYSHALIDDRKKKKKKKAWRAGFRGKGIRTRRGGINGKRVEKGEGHTRKRRDVFSKSLMNRRFVGVSWTGEHRAPTVPPLFFFSTTARYRGWPSQLFELKENRREGKRKPTKKREKNVVKKRIMIYENHRVNIISHYIP